MGGRSIALALLAFVVSATSAAAEDQKGCKLLKAVEFPVTMQGPRPLVPVKINGQDVLIMADSGAAFSTLSPEAVKRLGVKRGATPFGLRVRGVGGEASAGVVVADQLTLGRFPLKNVEFLVTDGVGGAAAGSVGLLGQNVLGFADVEYDLANGVIRLIVPKGDCSHGIPAYWATPTQSIGEMNLDETTPTSPHLTGAVTVDGRRLHATFDTGAATSIIRLGAAERLGFKRDGEGVESGGLGGGIGSRRLDSWIAPFQSFEIGGEVIKNTRIRVSNIEIDTDMLVGADFFLAHRVYVSGRRHKMYFTYNGGPVFRLDAPRNSAQPEPALAAQDVKPAGPNSDSPSDAAGYSRRGAAFAARRDFERAIQDFSRAIELEPKIPEHYDDRGAARLGNGQPILAMGDFEQALKLNPQDSRALLGRAELYLASRELARADLDFDAAAKSAGPDSEIPLTVAGIYLARADYDRALARYDTWVASHPKDPAGLNARCWARALAARQLEGALTDCDMAIREAGRTAAFLDSRALVKLRLGRYDAAIADYEAAIKLQPRNAWSLYGRGLAKMRKGQVDAGQADMAAALALRPGLREELKRAGLLYGADAPAASTAKSTQ